jgi:hypothetical protein
MCGRPVRDTPAKIKLGKGEPRAVFGRSAASLQERPVDLFNVNAAVLNCLSGIGDFQELARCPFIGKPVETETVHRVPTWHVR